MKDILAAFFERMGLNAYANGDFEAAVGWLRRLEAREGETLRVLRNLGVVLLAKGETSEAERYLRREEGLYGPSYHRHCALADLAYALGRREEALRRYEAARREEEAPRARAKRLVEERAAICADPSAFERAGRSADRFAAGEKARDSGELEAALTAFEEAYSLDPTNWPAMNNAGSILLNARMDSGRALELFSRAAALSGSPQAERNVEIAKRALGDEARKKARKAGAR